MSERSLIEAWMTQRQLPKAHHTVGDKSQKLAWSSLQHLEEAQLLELSSIVLAIYTAL